MDSGELDRSIAAYNEYWADREPALVLGSRERACSLALAHWVRRWDPEQRKDVA